MPEIKNIEAHSQEVQEIMGYIPNKVTRWGLTLIFIVLSGIIVGSFFFKSPETLTAPVVLTTQSPPVALVAKSTGKIERLFVGDGQVVDKQSIVALINNPTDFSHYLLMKEKLNPGQIVLSWDVEVMQGQLPDSLTLGDLQSVYSTYLKDRNSFKHYLIQNLLPQKIRLLEKQVTKQEEYYQTQLRQKNIQEQELFLSVKSFARDSALFKKQAISQSEYEKAKQQLLLKSSAYAGFEASLKNTESAILQMQEASVELQIQFDKELAQFRLALDETRQNLDNLIHQWEEKYLVSSPVKGKITFTTVWSENQEVKAGDLIATIVPETEMAIIAKAIIPSAGIGKVQPGQKVNIKLAGFPFMEFGMIRGKIRSISLVPDAKGYVAEIELTEGMTSTYRENLKFIQQMDGTAEIITKDIRLIYRFINPLKALIDKNF